VGKSNRNCNNKISSNVNCKNSRNCNGKNNISRNRRINDNSRRNRKGKDNRMAIVHVAFKSSSTAPPAAAHAQYIAREGQYQQRSGVELVESGNMPEFAQADPHSFWVAADAHERANGRTYTELQIALPRELDPAQRQELAREATRELLSDRFAYTLAVHSPLAKDNIDQPHMHLMFSERAVTETTREMPEERFFKRNGAKKDPQWNDRNKPEEVREKWVEMMNGAMQKAGIEQRLDSRSWAEQGREDLAALRELKTLQGNGPEAIERHEQIAEQRRQREELPAPHLDQSAAAEQIERESQKAVAEVEKRRDQELSVLDRLIERAKEFAVDVREKTVAAAKTVGSFFGVGRQEEEAKASPMKEQEQSSPPSLSLEERVNQKLAQMEGKIDFQESFAAKVALAEKRLDVNADKHLAAEQAKEKQESTQEKELSKEQSIDRSYGHGIGR
jgi:hypothetical protein